MILITFIVIISLFLGCVEEKKDNISKPLSKDSSINQGTTLPKDDGRQLKNTPKKSPYADRIPFNDPTLIGSTQTTSIDKSSYQLNPSNSKDAIRELLLDTQEGADILIVKPAEPYLDIISLAKDKANIPIAAYQVSGEYSRIWAAASLGWLDLDSCAMESLLSIKRAGANLVITYFAERMARVLK